MAHLGEGPGGGRVPLILGEKGTEMTEGRKAGWASKLKPGPLLSSKMSGSATDVSHNYSVLDVTPISYLGVMLRV